MVSTWTDGYVTDIEYTYGYYAELNPLRARLPLLFSGIALPSKQGDSQPQACELGYGQGITLNIHAAAGPCQWWGTDFNASHASFALSLARYSGAKVYDQSFAEFLRREDLPDFDFIAFHGIWSWISTENKKIIVDFLGRKLKVGGVLYVSYNSMPGWAAMLPMRELLLRYADSQGTGNTAERIASALNFAGQIFSAQPLYASANPQIAQRLEQLKSHDSRYLAHEYLNRYWNPVSFADMASWLAPAKLDFACSATMSELVDVINLSPEQIQLLNTIHDPILRETVRDFFCNTQFRRDYWVKGRRSLGAFERQEALEAEELVLTQARDTVDLTIKGARGEAKLEAKIYEPILSELSDYKPHSLGELAKALAPGGLNFAQLLEAVLILEAKGVCSPALPEGQRRDLACKALNRRIEELCRASSNFSWLACPLTGGGIVVGRFQALFLLAKSKGLDKPADWAQYAWEQLAALNQCILKDGKAIESPEDNLAELSRQAEEFAAKRLPILEALGVE